MAHGRGEQEDARLQKGPFLKCPDGEQGIQGRTSKGASLLPDEQALQSLQQLKPEPHVYCSGRKKNEPLNKRIIPKPADCWGWCISKRVVFFVESEAALPSEAGSN